MVDGSGTTLLSGDSNVTLSNNSALCRFVWAPAFAFVTAKFRS